MIVPYKPSFNGTRMTLIERIHTDLFLVLISDDRSYPRHPRSINPCADMKNALRSRFELRVDHVIGAGLLRSLPSGSLRPARRGSRVSGGRQS
jgi:hypothetical protein